jgi:KDO2-lipid IV(A) lauroyltransferase
MVSGLLLGVALRLADGLLRILPGPMAYGLADLAGRLWHRWAPERRALVTENLRRVAAWRGPVDAQALRRQVRHAFVAHARYYMELLRGAHYRPDRIEEMVSVDDWPHWREVLAAGVVVAIPHFGNFEPYGIFVGGQGLRALAPIEEIEPRVLFEFLRDRRGAGQVEVVPLRRARRPMIEALRRHEIVALVADRDLAGDGQPVTFFGHATTMPTGPAALSLIGEVPMIVAACRRVGHDRFRARGWHLDVSLTGDRRTDIAALTAAMAARFEEAIAEAPEQWWGAFQPIWLDQRAQRGPEAAGERLADGERAAPES